MADTEDLQKEVERLTAELVTKTREIDDLISSRCSTKSIYWIGIATGIAGLAYAFYIQNPFYVIISVGVGLVAAVGLIEAWFEKW